MVAEEDDSDDESSSEEDSEGLRDSHLKLIRANQIRMACCAIARGERTIIPPKWNTSKNGVCETCVDKRWTPNKLHRWKIGKLQQIHADHFNGVKGPTVYKEMFQKLRQHFCFYHNWKYYDVPETRLK